MGGGQLSVDVLGRVALVLAGIGVALPVLGAAVLFSELSYRPAYDRSDPDYQHYSDAFERLRVQLARRGPSDQDAIDLSQLNKSQWKIACVFGGYTDPLKTMATLGADIDEADRARMTEAARGFRLAPVEEFEVAIAYVDLGNSARFIHFKSGIGPDGQHFQKCISKPETRLYLAAT